MKVTVLINCYNAEKFIKSSIQSVFSQTYKNWKLLIWDDASTDKTLKIVESFKSRKIKIFKNKKNLGLGKSRLLAEKKIKTKYVAILDADDKFEKNKLEKLMKYFVKDKSLGLIASDYFLINELGKKLKKPPLILDDKNLLKNFCENNYFKHSTIMYNKFIAKKLGGYSKKLKYSQDYDLTIRMMRYSKVKYLRQQLAFYRMSNLNMSSDNSLRYLRTSERLYILKKIARLFNLGDHLTKINLDAQKLCEIICIYVSTNMNLAYKIYIFLFEFIKRPKIILIITDFLFKKFILKKQ